MANLSCEHCGAVTAPGKDCCSTGCDLARRIPRGEEGLPATWQLGLALGWGFLLFNQMLFAGMEFLAIGRGEPDAIGKFGLASNIAGVLVALVSTFLFVVSSPKKLSDVQAILLSFALTFVIWGRFGDVLRDPATVCFAFANLLIGLWLARGLLLAPTSKKRQTR